MDTPASGAGTSADDLPGRPATALARRGSRAVVVGTGTHAVGSGLPRIPAVAATIAAVRDTLISRCAMDAGHVATVSDPDGAQSFLSAVSQAADQAEDVLFLYYIGHGLVSVENELFLATRATTTRETMLPVEALPFAALRRVLSSSRARHVVVVLDCCFSGRASGSLGTAVADAFELASIHGSYLLSATSATEQALAPDGESYTAFSGALVKFLRDGDPGAPRGVTLQDAFRHLARVLPARGVPEPQSKDNGDTGQLVMAVNPQAPPVIPPPPPTQPGNGRPCPYPGLRAFTDKDAGNFFGREQLVAEILRTLATARPRGPLAIVGRSGAGKSSLLQAGLLPAIKDGRLEAARPGSRHWPQVITKPGEHPLRVLARRLADGTGQDAETITSALTADPQELPRFLGSALHDLPGLIVCVDQFEETFTTCNTEKERRAFIRALCAASASDGLPVQVILGLRADFYDRCLEYPELVPMVTAGQVPVRPMNQDELRSAIEGPAAAAGLQLQQGLTRRLLRDLGSAQGPGRDADAALPLLAFVLQATWQHSGKQTLTLSDYEATGGIEDAVTQRAEAVWESLEDGQDAAKLLLLSMVQLGDGTDDVRRRVNVEDALAGQPATSQAAIKKALEAYVDARLITVDNGTAEIAHEALLRAWTRLRQWIEDDRKELLGRQRLAEAARTWESNNGPLYDGARLEEARTWLDAKHAPAGRGLTLLEERFLRTSVRAVRLRRNRRQAAVAVLAVFAMVAASLAVWANQQRTEANQQRDQAIANQIEAEAEQASTANPSLAAQLLYTAYRMDPSRDLAERLIATENQPLSVTQHLADPAGIVNDVEISPDGRTMALSEDDTSTHNVESGRLTLWNVSNPERPRKLNQVLFPSGVTDGTTFSPDGRTLAVVVNATGKNGDYSKLTLWNVTNPERPQEFGQSLTHLGDMGPVAFSPNGRTLAVGDDDGVALWNVTNPAQLKRLGQHLTTGGAAVYSVAFSPDSRTLAVGEGFSKTSRTGGEVPLWNIANPAQPKRLGQPLLRGNDGAVNSVAFSPNGRTLAAGTNIGKFMLWNTTNPAQPTELGQPFTTTINGDVNSVAFSPDGSTLAVADTSSNNEVGEITRLDVTNPALPRKIDQPLTPAGGGAVGSAAFGPDGRTLIASGSGGTITRWSIPPSIPRAIGEQPTLSVNSVAFSPDGRTMAVGEGGDGHGEPNRGGEVTLWNLTNSARPKELGHPLITSDGSAVTAVAFSPDGRTLAISDADGYFGASEVTLWNITDPAQPKRLGQPLTHDKNAQVDSLAFSPNGRTLAASDGAVALWDIANLTKPRRASHSLTIDPTAYGGVVDSVAFSPDGRTLAAAGEGGSSGLDGEAALWNVTDPAQPKRLAQPLTTGVSGSAFTNVTVAFSPDSRTLAIGGAVSNDNGNDNGNGEVTLWNLADPAQPKRLGQPLTTSDSGIVDAVAFSPDDQTLAAGDAGGNHNSDGEVTLWNLANPAQAKKLGQPLTIGDNSQVASVAFSPDNRTLAVGDSSNTLQLWNTNVNYAISRICRLTSGDLARQQWNQYIPQLQFNPPCPAKQ